MSRRAADHPLVFLHLPRTAGTTVAAILTRRYRGESDYVIKSGDLAADIERFKALPEARRHRIGLLRGHMQYGLHEWLAPGARYLTVIRHPVARVASHYEYVKLQEKLDIPRAWDVGARSLADYGRGDISGELRNGQVRWLAGVGDDRPLDRSHLERAIDHVERGFDWVGVTERLDETLVQLAARMRWLDVSYQTRNVGARIQREALDAASVRAIEESNALDLELYRHVIARLDGASVVARSARTLGVAGLRLANRARAALRPAR